MTSYGGPAIVLAAYGSLFPGALAAYDQILAVYERELPGSAVRLAFTSQFMRRKLSEKGIFIPNPMTALAELQDQGQKDVVVQSLQIVPGQEFHQLASLVQGLRYIEGKFGFCSLELGSPLLTGLDDCRRAATALRGILHDAKAQTNPRDPEISLDPDEAVLWMGHGSGHPADGLYALMAQVLERYHARFFLSTLDGFPGLEDLIMPLKSCGAKRITLLPFLLVAGGHSENDMAGTGPGSWKSILEAAGFEVASYSHGLAESEEITAIFIDHTRRALERIKDRARSKEKSKE